MTKKFAHPYIPNSQPAIKAALLKALDMKSAEDIYKEIPEHLRYRKKMNIPEPIQSEYLLLRHVEGILQKNKNAKNLVCFLGGGTWQHYVPAVCDTIMERDEFLTAYVGEAYSDHGKFQALFETGSMICDLTGMDACNTPVYDWGNAVAIASRMASRTTGRKEILIASNAGPERVSIVKNYVKPDIAVNFINYDKGTGLLDLTDLKAKLSKNTAAVYFETPSYIGVIETQAAKICKLAKAKGALSIVGVDPSSLGVFEAPGAYGADYVVGNYQPLGQHMQFGGGCGGFICTHDDKKFIAEYPSLLFGMYAVDGTEEDGELGFGEVFYERTSYASREKGKDFVGTSAALIGITAGVYMALMGPQGFKELGTGILQRVAYTKDRLAQIPGVSLPIDSVGFSDFLVSFKGKSVAEVNKALLAFGVIGGKDVSGDFPEFGQSALYSVTEVHTKEDLDKLIDALTAIMPTADAV
ncbi:MAG: aminomethyl-transferring glycine dehydrogenase subunit GcvPA [Clostridiales Family XIII bacterium]|jgi:glycine dehydrogenase subunit 1|nr:aminomethyl-transferring glycine dehydrogenase subunit GcvPA [Clostridiales Family XIII bacterium]